MSPTRNIIKKDFLITVHFILFALNSLYGFVHYLFLEQQDTNLFFLILFIYVYDLFLSYIHSIWTMNGLGFRYIMDKVWHRRRRRRRRRECIELCLFHHQCNQSQNDPFNFGKQRKKNRKRKRGK